MIGHIYTPEQVQFIRDQLPGKTHRAFTELFNQHFNLSLSVSQITAAAKNRKINNGLNGGFKPGNVPFNKGEKGLNYPGMRATQFKAGHCPRNYMPVGSERINTYGYTDVKIADPRTWKAKHVLLWETAYGPVPKGHKLIFGDGDKRNITLDNLLLVTNGELAVMNKRHLYGAGAELTKAARGIARVLMATTIRKRELKRKKRL